MRIGFHERPYDLFALAGTCLAALAVIAGGSGPLRFTLAFLFVLVLPGYAITATVFPRKGDMDWVERVAMSIGLSLAVVPLLGVILAATPAGVRIEGVVGSLLLVTLGLSVVAFEQRMGLPQEDRLALSIDIEAPRWGDLPTVDRALALGVAAALVLGAGGIAYAIANPPPVVGFTEFYLLDRYGGVAPDARRAVVSVAPAPHPDGGAADRVQGRHGWHRRRGVPADHVGQALLSRALGTSQLPVGSG